MDLYKNNMLLKLKKPIKKYAIYVHDAIGGGDICLIDGLKAIYYLF